MMDLPLSLIEWRPCYRIVPSRFPPVGLFDAVADPADLEMVYLIEGMTNERLRDEAGEISLVPPEDRISGPGTTPIMAAFTHLNPQGDRFTNGDYGVFYAGLSLETSIAETRHHRANFLRATGEPAQDLDMRVYAVDLRAQLHDLRGFKESHPVYYHTDHYGMPQALGADLRAGGSYGIAYMSVRHEGGECAAVFSPPALSNCVQERHLCYCWDGHEISNIYEKNALTF